MFSEDKGHLLLSQNQTMLETPYPALSFEPQALDRELQGRVAWVELLQEQGKNSSNGITSTKTCQDVLFLAKL